MDTAAAASGDTEKLRRQLDEKDQKLKRLKFENAILNEKVNQLTGENKEINSNIDELDREHNAAIEELLTLKKSLQDKCSVLEKQLEANKCSTSELTGKHEQIEKSYTYAVHENAKLTAELNELHEKLNVKDEEIKELLVREVEAKREKSEYVEVSREKLLLDEKQEEIEQLGRKLAELQAAQNEVSDLKNSLNLLNAEKADAVQNYEQQKLKLNDNHKEIQTLTDHIKVLSAEKSSFDENNEKLNDKINYLTEQNYEYEKNCNDLQTELQLLQLTYDKNEVDLEKRCSELEAQFEQQKNENRRNYDEYETFKAEASESESKLVQENVVLQKQVIDLNSLLNSKRIEGSFSSDSMESNDSTEKLQDLQQFAKETLNIDGSTLNSDEILQLIRDAMQNYNQIHEDLTTSKAKYESTRNELERTQHDKETIQADMHHYEIEVAELMKNNELLLMEIDNLKTGTLETILEHNEDNIVLF